MNKVRIVKTMEECYDVISRVSPSLERMRKKIMNVKDIKWGWHVVLTFKKEDRESWIKRGGFGGFILKDFLRNLRGSINGFCYFWKYEEGRLLGKPHFHLLLDFGKTNITKAFLGESLYKARWRAGDVNLDKIVKKFRRKYPKRQKERSDLEFLMGRWLWRKWKQGGVYAKEIKGMGWQHRFNLLYYVNKDLMKPTNLKLKMMGKAQWKFGKGYAFNEGEIYQEDMLVSENKAISHLMRTKFEFIKSYNKLMGDGESKFFSKIRAIKSGKLSIIIK